MPADVPAALHQVQLNQTAHHDLAAASTLASCTRPAQALLAFALREAGGALREPKLARAAAACILRACEGAVAAGLAVPQDALAALLQTLAPPTGLEPQVPPTGLALGAAVIGAAEEQEPFKPGLRRKEFCSCEHDRP